MGVSVECWLAGAAPVKRDDDGMMRKRGLLLLC